MNRIFAFGTHLAISLIVFAILGYIIVFHWYPDFFFTTDGGWQGIRIVAFVDLVLGPTLTLVVYRKGKPGLRTDLTLIGLFQALCLAAGMWVVYMQRPLAMVYSDGYFISVTIDDYESASLPVPDLEQFPGLVPVRVAVQLPEGVREEAEIRRQAYQAGVPLRAYAQYYVPFSMDLKGLAEESFSKANILAADQKQGFLAPFFSKHGGTIDDYLFFPFGTRYSTDLIALRLADGEMALLSLPEVKESGDPSGDEDA